MIEDDDQVVENQTPTSHLKLTRRGAAVITTASILAGGGAVAAGVEHHLNDEKTIVDSTHFSVSPGDTLIQDASEAAQRLALHEKVDPAKLPSVVYPAQEAQSEVGGTVQPGQGFTLEKTASDEFKIVPDEKH